MNIAHAYNCTIATLLIVIYLALPATVFAHAASLEFVLTSEATYSAEATVPCDDSPCSDGQKSDCCDTAFCICECHAPVGQNLRLNYTPVIASQNFWEKSWSLPQVYRPIFVPPQNLF
jgi:hypothetical protein